MILSNTPEVIITNFDVLHYHLWHRTKFSYLLRTSQFLFVDEAHTYTGVFGANVHHIVKRLERLCKNKLQIIARLRNTTKRWYYYSVNLGTNFIFLATNRIILIYGAGILFATDNGLMWPSVMSKF